jgi:hypothetical protein
VAVLYGEVGDYDMSFEVRPQSGERYVTRGEPHRHPDRRGFSFFYVSYTRALTGPGAEEVEHLVLCEGQVIGSTTLMIM